MSASRVTSRDARDQVAIWISGASSGIGAALADSVPHPGARLFGISRRPPRVGEHVEAGLAQPAVWPAVAAHFEEVLGRRQASEVVFLHMSGIGTPAGPVTDADLEAYTAADELLDAHDDTSRLACAMGELDPAWSTHLDSVRAVQRKGREAVAELALEVK